VLLLARFPLQAYELRRDSFIAPALSKMQFSTLLVHGIQWRHVLCAQHGENCGQL